MLLKFLITKDAESIYTNLLISFLTVTGAPDLMQF